MKIFCECGWVIYDQTDYISYKATFVADRDSSDLLDRIEEQIKKLVKKIEQTVSNKIDTSELIEDTMTDVSDVMDEYAIRNIYQCLGCGRLFVDDAQFNSHVFIRQDDSVPKNLMRSIKGDKWKRCLRGNWQESHKEKDKGKGELSWGFGDEEEGYDRFDDLEALKKKYFEVFTRLQEKGILRDAFLRRGTEVLHIWPEKDID
jgi:hypothetical protein